MSHYQLRTVKDTQIPLLYLFLKASGTWVEQKDVVKFRGKDDSRTRKLLKRMESQGFVKSKLINNRRFWKIR